MFFYGFDKKASIGGRLGAAFRKVKTLAQTNVSRAKNRMQPLAAELGENARDFRKAVRGGGEGAPESGVGLGKKIKKTISTNNADDAATVGAMKKKLEGPAKEIGNEVAGALGPVGAALKQKYAPKLQAMSETFDDAVKQRTDMFKKMRSGG